MSAIFEWVGPVDGFVGDFVWQKQWYFFEGWQRTATGWVRLYKWGPVSLNANELAEQQRQLFASMKPAGSYDYADVYVWEEAVGHAGLHWAPVTYRSAPGIPLEAGQEPRGPIPDPPAEGGAVPLNLGPLLQQLRTNISSGWDATVRAYNDCSATLARLGQSFTGEDTQRVLDVKKLAQVASTFIDEALSGKRTVGYDASGKMVIEALPGDEYRIEVQNGAPVVVDARTNQRVQGAGTVGFDPVTITGVIVIGAVALGGIYLCVTAIDAVKTQIHASTVAKALEATGCGKPGQAPCTPEQIAAMTTAINKSQAELERESKSNLGEELTQTAGSVLKTVLWLGAAAAAIYVGVQVIPPLLRARAAA